MRKKLANIDYSQVMYPDDKKTVDCNVIDEIVHLLYFLSCTL